MDFGMYMPPAGYTPYTGPGKPSDEITAVYASADFQYSGVTQNYYLYVIVGLCLIFWRVPTDDFWRYSYQLGQHNNYLLMTIATLTAMLVGAILNWIIIDADKTCMIIRRPILFMRREIALDSIKKAKIYTEKTSRLGKTTFLTVDLKSGKSFDLFLFKQARNDLASFLTNNITP